MALKLTEPRRVSAPRMEDVGVTPRDEGAGEGGGNVARDPTEEAGLDARDEAGVVAPEATDDARKAERTRPAAGSCLTTGGLAMR